MVALIAENASIDFMCFPRFDSPTIFAGLLDQDKGGCFKIHPVLDRERHKQLYLPDSNILVSRFLSEQGVAEVSDCQVQIDNCWYIRASALDGTNTQVVSSATIGEATSAISN